MPPSERVANEPPGAQSTNRSIVLYPSICTMSSLFDGDITEKHSLRSTPASHQTAYGAVPVMMGRRKRVTQFPEVSVPINVT